MCKYSEALGIDFINFGEGLVPESVIGKLITEKNVSSIFLFNDVIVGILLFFSFLY